MPYPPAQRLGEFVHAHGRSLPDPYHWLEDVDDERTRIWLDAQTQLGHAYLGSLPSRQFFRDQLEKQFDHGIPGTPDIRGNRTFVVRRDPGQQLLSLRVRDGAGPWRALVDPNALDAEGHTILDASYPSSDGGRVAYLLSRGGDEASELRVMDVETGADVDGPITRCHALGTTVSWLPGRDTFYYSRRAPDGRWLVYLHRVGSPPDDDLEIFGRDRAPLDWVYPSVSPDGRWLVLGATQPPAAPVDLFVVDVQAGGPVEPLLSGAESHTSWGPDGRLYVRTALGAPKWRLCFFSLPSRELIELVAEDDVGVLQGYAVVGDCVVCNHAHRDVSRLTVRDRATGGFIRDVPLPGEGTVGGPLAHGDRIWFVYNDFTTPSTTWTWRAGEDHITEWEPFPRDTATDMVVERVEFHSDDGTLVPMVVFRRGELDGPRPTLLYAYGGFGYSVLRPAFDHWATAWTAAGGVYAICGCRGGGEYGGDWHRAGMRENKQRTFEDFLSAARWLVGNGYAAHDMLGASGLSNGALTVSASVNLSPETFAAVICTAMGCDMLRPLREGAEGWVYEYGDGRVAEEFDWLLSYSPYHNTREGVCYPATLVNTFGKDTRTPPYEGHKYVALLQWTTSCERPIVLRHEEEAGHSTRSVRQMVDLLTDWLAFAAENLGLRVPEGAEA